MRVSTALCTKWLLLSVSASTSIILCRRVIRQWEDDDNPEVPMVFCIALNSIKKTARSDNHNYLLN